MLKHISADEYARAQRLVDSGMRLLTRRTPRWLKRVDLEQFDVRDFHRCPLAYAYGDYNKGRAALNLSTEYEAARFGFALGPELMHWETLNAVWRERIRAHRAASRRRRA